MAYQAHFRCAFGVKGGIDETNLSAYLLAPVNTQNYICLDAGTINAGIEKSH
jgi:3',5'-cyclic-nucleotide phosphodiesterase